MLSFARELCYHIPVIRDLGQWLCVPPFRVVYLYQALNAYMTFSNSFSIFCSSSFIIIIGTLIIKKSDSNHILELFELRGTKKRRKSEKTSGIWGSTLLMVQAWLFQKAWAQEDRSVFENGNIAILLPEVNYPCNGLACQARQVCYILMGKPNI